MKSNGNCLIDPYGYTKIDSCAPLWDMSFVHAGRAFIQKWPNAHKATPMYGWRLLFVLLCNWTWGGATKLLKNHMYYLGLQLEDTKHLTGSFQRMCAACVLPKQAGLSIPSRIPRSKLWLYCRYRNFIPGVFHGMNSCWKDDCSMCEIFHGSS